jgi:hypothetical protein
MPVGCQAKVRSDQKRVRIAGDELDEVGLAMGAGLVIEAAEMVFTVVSPIPSASAASGMPPTLSW